MKDSILVNCFSFLKFDVNSFHLKFIDFHAILSVLLGLFKISSIITYDKN